MKFTNLCIQTITSQVDNSNNLKYLLLLNSHFKKCNYYRTNTLNSVLLEQCTTWLEMLSYDMLVILVWKNSRYIKD